MSILNSSLRNASLMDAPAFLNSGTSTDLPPHFAVSNDRWPHDPHACTTERVRVDGLRFSIGGKPFRLQGVTYGPFAPDSTGDPLPPRRMVDRDFALMRKAGINAIRIYCPPPNWFLDSADEHGMRALLDIPCPKHLDFAESRATVGAARKRVRSLVEAVRGRSCVLGCSVGNEISPELVRWYGPGRIERFLGDLVDVARQADPDGLVTYGNFPSTEYLDLPFLDFRMFNVYLHDPAAFRRYVRRLQTQSIDRPVVLGELGMDTLRNGDAEQARFLAGHLCEASRLGVAGSFVFSWTDDWYTNNWQIEDWAFGITRRDRTPKSAYHAVSSAFNGSPANRLPERPRVSVVVCSYNGGNTLEQCLNSLGKLEYSHYEVILVDDGSTDRTPDIARKFPGVQTIRQENQGLSVARNVGLSAATGDIVAYTDSDCFADPNWLTTLVDQLETSGAAAVGGPNLTPEDGWLAGCVACAPGQPTHVLESDDDAEHIPGCNMAFRRDVLLALGGFDAVYRKAGDDVDICWRLREAGHRITFSPGAFVWHHRRQNPSAYLKQQAGYGEAEALLARKHPDRFNAWGAGKWRGVLYGNGLTGLRLGRKLVHSGVFGQGLFQSLYQPAPAHWAMLPTTLEWHAAIAIALTSSLILGTPPTWIAALMALITIIVSLLQAWQASPPMRHDGLRTRIVIAGLCWLQPLVRSYSRYRTRYGTTRPSAGVEPTSRLGSLGVHRYITLDGIPRETFLRRLTDELRARGVSPAVDSGWSPWDLEVPCGPGSHLQVRTVQEWYAGNSAQIAVAFSVRRTAIAHALLFATLVAVAAGLRSVSVHNHVELTCSAIMSAVVGSAWLLISRNGTRQALRATAVLDDVARSLGMTPHPATPEASEKL